MNHRLNVATINILNDLTRWKERFPLLASGLDALAPDLIALQEVTDPLGHGTAQRLAEELRGYSLHICPKTGWSRGFEGIAVLSRLPVENHEILDLGSQQRTAQLVFFHVGGRPVVLVNGHYYWLPGIHSARVRQVERVFDRLRSLDPVTAVVACGDFNGTPESPAVMALKRYLNSAYENKHGKEPEYTCPTPLISGRLRDGLTRGLLRLFTNRPGETWRGTLDYIFVSPDIRVVDCRLFLDHPSPDDPTLYASDHIGLAATLEIIDSDEPR